MAADIKEFDPCATCIRTRHGHEFSNQASRDAGAYLLLTALEQADPLKEATPNPDDEQAMSNFVNNSYGDTIPRGAQGAVGHCGRAIGRGACPDWQIDVQSVQIVPSTQNHS